MRHHAPVPVGFAVALLLGLGSAQAAEGVIDGVIAVRFDAVSATTQEPLADQSRVSVHLVPPDDPGRETVEPAGRWFLPPGDAVTYTVWLEGPGLISERQSILEWHRRPDDGTPATPKRVPVVTAASVLLAGAVTLGEMPSWRILQLESGFIRHLNREQAREAVQVPPGQVVAWIVDETTGTPAALSRPTTARAGTPPVTVVASRRSPPNTDLMLRLAWPAPTSPAGRLAVRLRAPDGSAVSPDAIGNGVPDRFAFFYGLDLKEGTVELEAEDVWLPSTVIRMSNGGVTYERLAVRPKSSLTVNVLLPPEIRDRRTLSVESRGAVVATRDVRLDETKVDLEHLPPTPCVVRLRIGLWELREEVDLSQAPHEDVTFQPQVYHVHGTVYVGDTPTAGKVQFLAVPPDNWVTAETDEDGNYAIDLLGEPDFIQVTAAGSTSPSPERPDIEFTADTELDFHLGSAFLKVEVVSAADGSPVGEARVMAGGVVSETGTMSATTGSVTDAEGIAKIGPIRPAQIVLRVTKDGWQTHVERVTVGDEDSRTLHVALEPEGETSRVTVVLPDGRPASGARAFVFASLQGGTAWQGTADAAGIVKIPNRACCVATFLHDAAGLTVLDLPTDDRPATQRLRMLPAAGPLRLMAVTPQGDPVPWAKVRIWLDGRLLGNEVTSMLFRTPLAANWEGVWGVTGLAPARVDVLCWRAGALNDQGQAGLLDGQRVSYGYPWPALIKIPVVE